MQTFLTYEEARTKQIKDDAYSQDEIILSVYDLMSLKEGKIIYHNFDGKSCIIKMDNSIPNEAGLAYNT